MRGPVQLCARRRAPPQPHSKPHPQPTPHPPPCRLPARVHARRPETPHPDPPPPRPPIKHSALAAGGAAPGAPLDFEAFRRAAARAPALRALLTGLLARTGLGQRGAAAGPNSPRQAVQQQQQQHLRGEPAAASSSGGECAAGAAGALAHLLELPALVTAAPGGAGPLPKDGLLQPEWVWLLAPGLPPALRREWRLLFSSARHGASFNTFMGRVAGAAPTLLLVRDAGGAVFGGVAHAPWRRSGAFFGAPAGGGGARVLPWGQP
jgi:hypothetical protein